MKLKSYAVVTGSTLETLMNSVNSLIEMGYQPIGGVSHADVSGLGNDHSTYIQAMGQIEGERHWTGVV